MADRAFEWAKARGLCRKNPIHGEEEADIPKDEEWIKTRSREQDQVPEWLQHGRGPAKPNR